MQKWLTLFLDRYIWYQNRPNNPVWSPNEDINDLSGGDCDAPI